MDISNNDHNTLQQILSRLSIVEEEKKLAEERNKQLEEEKKQAEERN